MTILNHATAAERERGLVWASDFTSASKITEYGGAITGAVTFSNGVILDGSTNYITFNNVDGKFNSATVSFVIRFVPYFNTDEDVTRYLIDTTNGSRFLIVKERNAANNVLTIYLGNALIANIAEATYTGSWNINEENILVLTSTTKDTSVWLNGTQILTDDNTGWGALNPTEFIVGSKYDGSDNFYGKINSIKVFKEQLTDDEADDFSDGSTYNYINLARANYPLNFANHDLTNTRALDISGNDYHVSFGTGAVGTFPTKNATFQGYDFYSGDFMSIDSGLGITSYPITMSLMLRTQSAGIVCAIDLADSSSGAKNMSIRIDIGDLIQASIRSGGGFYAAGTFIGNSGNWIHAVAVFSSATSRSIYIDGTLEATETTSVAFFTPDRFTIGRFGDLTPGANVVGDMAKPKVWNIELTPLQIKDLYLRDIKKFSEV